MAGKLVHYELPASDTGRAKEFYVGLFGWVFNDSGMPGIDYQLIDGDPGGALYRSDDAGSGPRVYFDTEDIDASVAKVRELGGEADDKAPIPGIGWSAGCKDLDGNHFSLVQSDESAPAPNR